ncbi:MAG: hypothetical protein AAF226_16305 [Verrucomicrobiota bacterium]
MKNLFPLLFVGLFSVCSAQEEVQHIMTTSCAGLPEEADFKVKPIGYDFGIKLTFLITGENLIEIDKESLKTEARGWTMGHFPKVNEEGTLATFSISKNQNLLNKEPTAAVKGSIAITTGSETDEQSFALKKGETKEVAGLKVSLQLTQKGFSSESVKVTGDFSKVKSILVTQNGTELETRSSSWTGDQITYAFEGIKEGAEVTLVYWTDLQKKTIEFQK